MPICMWIVFLSQATSETSVQFASFNFLLNLNHKTLANEQTTEPSIYTDYSHKRKPSNTNHSGNQASCTIGDPPNYKFLYIISRVVQYNTTATSSSEFDIFRTRCMIATDGCDGES